MNNKSQNSWRWDKELVAKIRIHLSSIWEVWDIECVELASKSIEPSAIPANDKLHSKQLK